MTNPFAIPAAGTLGPIIATAEAPAGSVARRAELTAFVRSALAHATDGQTFQDLARVFADLLAEAAQAEAQRRPVPVTTAADRLDRAWETVWNSHLSDTLWSMSFAESLGVISTSATTLMNMRRAVRELKAAEVPATGRWRWDQATARTLAATAEAREAADNGEAI